MKFLLEQKAQVDATEKDGTTPLHKAAYSGNTDVVKVLLDAGAPINAVDSSGATALHHAAEQVSSIFWILSSWTSHVQSESSSVSEKSMQCFGHVH